MVIFRLRAFGSGFSYVRGEHQDWFHVETPSRTRSRETIRRVRIPWPMATLPVRGNCRGHDQFAQLIANRHRFDNRQAPAYPELATVAATAAIERHAIEDAGVNEEILVHFRRIGDGSLQCEQMRRNEALGAGENYRGRNQERSNAMSSRRAIAPGVVAMHSA